MMPEDNQTLLEETLKRKDILEKEERLRYECLLEETLKLKDMLEKEERLRFECLSLIIKNSHDLTLDQIIEAATRFENYIRNGGEEQLVDQDVKATTRFDHYINKGGDN
jgi:hypothetical protein